jgi:hypothetical protein
LRYTMLTFALSRVSIVPFKADDTLKIDHICILL